MIRTAYAALAAIVVGLFLLLSSVFVVTETQKALVLQFGQIRQVIEEPGLGFKVPFIQSVVYYDDRILSLDTEEIEVTPSDDRRLVVDAFARYRIADPVRFRQAVGAGGTTRADALLNGILNDQIRGVLGSDQVTSDTILSSDRRTLMTRIREGAQTQAATLGIDVVDVRLKTTNLPAQNLDATFARMRAEREREAADEIARGNEAALRVRAQADRTVVETLSQAQSEAEVTRGEADAEANGIFAEAYGADPDFFEFYRSMQAYEQALSGSNSTMVMTSDSAFLSYLYDGAGSSSGAAAPAAVAAPAAEPTGEPAVEPAADPAVEPAPAAEPPAADPVAEPAAVPEPTAATGGAPAIEPAVAP